MFRIKHQNSIFYNYIGLWSCHHHVKTAKKLDFGFCFLKKKSFKENVDFQIFKKKQNMARVEWAGSSFNGLIYI